MTVSHIFCLCALYVLFRTLAGIHLKIVPLLGIRIVKGAGKQCADIRA